MSDVELISATRLLRHYRRDLFDAHALSRARLEHALGELSCSRGCAFCCYAKVVIDLGQGILIYLWLKSTGAWTSALEARLLEAEAAMAPVPHAEWLPRRVPCVFLKEYEYGKGICTVYPVRPLACATMFSAGRPADCGETGGKNLVTIHMTDAESLHFVELYGSLQQGVDVQEPLALTIAGAVLYAHALVEGQPLPEVRRVPIREMQEAGGEDPFDAKVCGKRAAAFDDGEKK